MKTTKIKSIDEVLEESTPITTEDVDEIAADTYTAEIRGYRVSDIPEEAYTPGAHYTVDILPTGLFSTLGLAVAQFGAEGDKKPREKVQEEENLTAEFSLKHRIEHYAGVFGQYLGNIQDKIPGVRHIGVGRATDYLLPEGVRQPQGWRKELLQKMAYNAINEAGILVPVKPEDIHVTMNGNSFTAQVNGESYRSKPLTSEQVEELKDQHRVYELKETDMIEVMPTKFPPALPTEPRQYYRLAA